MKAAVLQDIERIEVQTIPDPEVPARELLIRVRSVGVCGTDLHIFQGHGNFNLDDRGHPIPLNVQPQILGHEFSGEVLEVGPGVKNFRVGDLVLCDQGRNCHSYGRDQLCSYCSSGDSHQCQHYGEHGITGLQGAMADYISMPAVNCLPLPEGMPTEQGALVEPLGCILHASARAERSEGRYRFNGEERIGNVLICGAGAAGLLFLQYLRQVKKFDGVLLVSDVRDRNLELAKAFGGIPINPARQDLGEAVREITKGQRLHYLIDACGNAVIFEQIPGLLRKQGTVLLYGLGHKGRDVKLLSNIQFLEPTLVAAVGASGGFDPDGRPSTYRRSLELLDSGIVQAAPFVTHRYRSLDEIHKAFEQDFQQEDYIKGVLNLRGTPAGVGSQSPERFGKKRGN